MSSGEFDKSTITADNHITLAHFGPVSKIEKVASRFQMSRNLLWS